MFEAYSVLRHDLALEKIREIFIFLSVSIHLKPHIHLDIYIDSIVNSGT